MWIVGADPRALSKRRKPGQDAAHFKTDKTGKIVIHESDNEDDMNVNVGNGVGTAFVAAQSGADGASRDVKGNLRFNKNTKRVRAQEEAMGMDLDEVMGDKDKSTGGEFRKKKKSSVVGRLGEEFKAKVGRPRRVIDDGADVNFRERVGISRDSDRWILMLTSLLDKQRGSLLEEEVDREG